MPCKWAAGVYAFVYTIGNSRFLHFLGVVTVMTPTFRAEKKKYMGFEVQREGMNEVTTQLLVGL